MENGYFSKLDLELVARWCRVTGHHEVWKLIESIVGLEVLAVPPIHPELNKCLGDSIINFRKQMREAAESTQEIEELWNKRKPGKRFNSENIVQQAKHILDLKVAIDTVLYSLERECGLNLDEVAKVWSQNVVSKEIALISEEELITCAI